MFHTIRQEQLEYLTADALEGSIHCFSTRFGGVSEGHLASLNLGAHRGDRPENVWENYRILGRAVGFAPEQTVLTKQEHTDTVLRVGKADCGTGLLREQTTVCDGLITNEPGTALCCFGADCTPILLYDPVRRAAGAVHSGWRGTAMGIAAKAVAAMGREFGCDPADLRAAIGPCIGLCCFEVGPEVAEAMRTALGADAEPFLVPHGEKYHADLKGLNRLWLEQAGLRTIDTCPDCTKCQPQRFWSHRTVGNARGSQAGIIMIKE